MPRSPRLTLAALTALIAFCRRHVRGATYFFAVLGRGDGEPHDPGLARFGRGESLGTPSGRMVVVRDLWLGLLPPDFHLAVPRRGEAAPVHIGGDRRVLPLSAPRGADRRHRPDSLAPAGVPVGLSSLAMGGPEHNPAPQFVAVAGAGPQPIIPVSFGGQSVRYVPAGPNRFYTFECSAHAALTLVFGMLGAIFGAAISRRAARGSTAAPG